MPLSAGEKLGPYEILAPIGAGGMGDVKLAAILPPVANLRPHSPRWTPASLQILVLLIPTLQRSTNSTGFCVGCRTLACGLLHVLNFVEQRVVDGLTLEVLAGLGGDAVLSVGRDYDARSDSGLTAILCHGLVGAGIDLRECGSVAVRIPLGGVVLAVKLADDFIVLSLTCASYV